MMYDMGDTARQYREEGKCGEHDTSILYYEVQCVRDGNSLAHPNIAA